MSALNGPPQAILGLAGLQNPLLRNGRRGLSELTYLDQACDAGYAIMDTAAIYGLGASERGLGRWMGLRRNRDRLVIISKGGHPRIWRPGRHRITVEDLTTDLTASLERLGTDYIDVYMLHRDAVECDVPAVLHYLHEQKGRGRIRMVGVSNWHHERIESANMIARQRGLTEIAVSSPQLSLLSWTRPPWRGCLSISGGEGAAARSWYRQNQLPVLAWSPLGGGLTETPGEGWSPTGACYSHPANQERLSRAAVIAGQRGISVPQVLMAYVTSLSCLVHPIVATRNTAHLHANRAALHTALLPEEIRMLEG